MPNSLESHPKAFQVAWSELFAAAATCGTGWPYARRHWEMGGFPHRLVALVEAMPVVGGVAAACERAFYGVFGLGYGVPWRGRPLCESEALRSMLTNQQLAVKEKGAVGPYISRMAVSEEDLTKGRLARLSLLPTSAEMQGPRESMEDAKFILDQKDWLLAGVFDGHGGGEVSRFACNEFKRLFPKVLKGVQGNVHQAFEVTIHQIHIAVANRAKWNKQGTTATVCFVDKSSHLVYTATLGDSEAKIYRSGRWGTQSIPLSCVRDWLSPSDRSRLEAAHGVEVVGDWIRRTGGDPKKVRSKLQYGVNVSRCIGDVGQAGTYEHPLVIHRPIITVNRLLVGDQLVIGCDGIWDFVDERKIAGAVGWRSSFFFWLLGCKRNDLAEELIGLAKGKTHDNVTVIGLEVHLSKTLKKMG